jgi:2-oxoglutarate ferredoxin oxidoreductase subunit gamma
MSGTKSGFSQPAIGEGPAPKRVGLLAARDFLEIRIGGEAGQGVVLMGLVLATAATRDHRYVTQTQTHGLEEGEAQGHCDVIISDDPVDYPELLGADVLVALRQDSADAHVSMVRADGVFVFDSDNVTDPPHFEGVSYGIPFEQLAREASGKGEAAPDLLALGMVNAITGVVSAASLEKTLDDLVLPGSKEAMQKALAYGLKSDFKIWQRGPGCS